MANQAVKVWRDCSVCLEPVQDHNQFYLHVKTEHPNDFITNEVRQHYAQQVYAERFINQEAQPLEWLCEEAVICPELVIIFGEEDPITRMSGRMTPNLFTFEENSILLLNALTKLRISGRYYTPPTSPQPKRARVEGVSFNTFDLTTFLDEQIPITHQDMNASDEELTRALFDKGLMNPIVPKLKIEDFYAMVADKQ